MEQEIWKDVVGWEGDYMVSSYGRIMMKEHSYLMPNGGTKVIPHHILNTTITKNKYVCVSLKKRMHYVHRLVARAFPEICGLWFDDCQVDHINTIRNDNMATNLRIVSAHENSTNPITIKHQREAKLGKKMPIGFGELQRQIHLGNNLSCQTKKKIRNSLLNNPLISKRVLQLDLDGKVIKEWASSKEAERHGFHHGSINLCCKGIYKQHKGFVWKYKEV